MRLARIVHLLLACWTVAFATVACASRSVPANEPRSSAASLEAPEAAPHTVTQALGADAPLPGPESAGWVGLEQQGAAGGHEHHGHEHQHAPAPAEEHPHGAPPAQQGAPTAPGSNEATPAGVQYVCPMHPEVVSPEPGRCPRCGMALVKRP